MAERFVLPVETAFDSNGDPISGAQLFFYASGTSTPLDTYSDSGLTTPNTNPVVADSAGRFGSIFLGTSAYTVILKDADSVTIWTRDPVAAPAGVSEASQAEVDARTSTSKFVSPAKIADGVGLQGASIASAAALTLPDVGDYFNITGTTNITSISTRAAGREINLVFPGALTFTHNATSLILPGAANITTAAGDSARLRSEGGGNWRCVSYMRAAAPPDSFATAFAHFREEQSTSVAAAETALTASGWTKRTLNTTKANLISGVSIASSQVTLPAGRYYVRAHTPVYNNTAGSGSVKARLRNVTDSSDILSGSSELLVNSSVAAISGRSFINGSFTLAAQKVVELDTWVNNATGAMTGGFPASASGAVEVYSEIEIWKIA